MTDQTLTYGISYGNGNDGVSHMFPDFYCTTDKPYDLARLAIITNMKDAYQDWAAEEVDVQGEAEFGIQGCLYEGPDGETEFGAAYMLADVFLVDDSELPDASDPYAKLVYANLDECFGADVVARFVKA